MAKFRTSGTALSKTFERSTSIIYLVDGESRVLYANQACSDWVGVPISELFGCQLKYAPDPTAASTDHRLSGLCPPPDLWSESGTALTDASTARYEFVIWAVTAQAAGTGLEMEGHVAGTESERQVEYRRAQAHCLTDQTSEEELILVIGQDGRLNELPWKNQEGSTGPLASRDLHLALAELQRQMRLTYSADSLVGVSRFAAGLRRQVQTISQGASDLVIEGEPGCGKQHLARVIAAQTQNPNPHSLIPVDCRSLDFKSWQGLLNDLEKLRRSKNHPEPPSSPLADDRPQASKMDRIQLLLLHVDQLLPAIHQPLYEWLLPERGRFSNRPIQVLATADRSLTELAGNGGFHAELAQILTTSKILVLPLRERLEDVPFLAQSMLERCHSDHPVIGFDRQVLGLLGEYRWPGNLDQLRQLVMRANQQAAGSLISTQHLPQVFHDALTAQRFGKFEQQPIQLVKLLEDIERDLIERALQLTQGNKAQAARLLSLSRNKLLRRLQYFELDTDESAADATGSVPLHSADKKSSVISLRDKVKRSEKYRAAIGEESMFVESAKSDDPPGTQDTQTSSGEQENSSSSPTERTDQGRQNQSESAATEADSDWIDPEAFEEID